MFKRSRSAGFLLVVFALVFIKIADCAPEDYVEPDAEEEEEIIIRDDGTSLEGA